VPPPFPTVDAPPPHSPALPESTGAKLAAAANEAQLGLAKLHGWIQGLSVSRRSMSACAWRLRRRRSSKVAPDGLHELDVPELADVLFYGVGSGQMSGESASGTVAREP
jgi:hypothetical protein